jgi:transcriptional regulator with XRE-family HTH domain
MVIIVTMNEGIPRTTRGERARLFRERLSETMQAQWLNRSTLAERAGVDRSTISLLLSEQQVRLPSGHVVAELAAALNVTADWLLGLTTTTRAPGQILRESLEVAERVPGHSDANIERWLNEAADAKVRNVPASLPEFMKTEAVMTLEYADYASKSPQQALAENQARLTINRLPGRDTEIALPRQRLEDFARRAGIWVDLSAEQVHEQLLQIADLCEELYPSTRLHLYDQRRHYSAPITVFGQRRAVIYVGSSYFVFNTPEHVQTLTRHFDQLVRDASVLSHETPLWLRALAARAKP